MKKFLAVLLLMLGMTNFCWAQENAQTGENAKMHEFMLKAVAEAEKNIISMDGGPFGAVIVKDGVIVGTGHNEVLKIMTLPAMRKCRLSVMPAVI